MVRLNKISKMVERAKTASAVMALLPTSFKNRALNAMADSLDRGAKGILAANARDLAAAR